MKLRPQAGWMPLVPLYAAAVGLKNMAYGTGLLKPERLEWPVISVGNLSVGGTGKTPFVMMLAELLGERGWLPDVLSRGYGRTINSDSGSEVQQVDPNGSAAQSGDEPLLIARKTGIPVFVGRSRYQAGRLAEAVLRKRMILDPEEHAAATNGSAGNGIFHANGNGSNDHNGHIDSAGTIQAVVDGAIRPNVEVPHDLAIHDKAPRHIHLLDDGFQHRRLARGVDIVLVGARDAVDRLLPAGRLREPVGALHRAHIVVLREPEEGENVKEAGDTAFRVGDLGLPVWRMRRTLRAEGIGPRPLAFCGLANPDNFFSGLERSGYELAGSVAFPDHHRYVAADARRLVEEARRCQAGCFVTTEKDAVKLDGGLVAALLELAPLCVVPLVTELLDVEGCMQELEEMIDLAAEEGL